ncbi:flippase-like domain-containing protein [Azospirillum doebereinerae]|uniref:Flippase-like domain-containing protein n=2 Tax=Azospirillum doebereinerae TaxID=92933 RepID=A0A433J6N9_9PROT|nr:flippase-like domain-containing protein [Azospirillum doebereinerae]
MPFSFENSAPPLGQFSGRAKWMLAAKGAVTVLLVAWLLRRVDWLLAADRLRHADGGWLFGGFALVCGALLVTTIRWQWAGAAVGLSLPLNQAVRHSLVGQFFGQVLPAGVGVDAVRGWLAYRSGHPAEGVVASLLIDRLAGLLGLLLLDIVAAVTLLYHIAPDFALAGLLAGAVMVGSFAAVLFLNRIPLPARLRLRLFDTLRTILRSAEKGLTTPASLNALALSLLVQILFVGAVLLLARALGAPIGVQAGFAVVPIALTLASMPISLNGWGIREGAMVAGLQVHGVGVDDAFLVSVLLGTALLLASLPGGLLWFFKPPERPS